MFVSTRPLCPDRHKRREPVTLLLRSSDDGWLNRPCRSNIMIFIKIIKFLRHIITFESWTIGVCLKLCVFLGVHILLLNIGGVIQVWTVQKTVAQWWYIELMVLCILRDPGGGWGLDTLMVLPQLRSSRWSLLTTAHSLPKKCQFTISLSKAPMEIAVKTLSGCFARTPPNSPNADISMWKIGYLPKILTQSLQPSLFGEWLVIKIMREQRINHQYLPPPHPPQWESCKTC